MKSIPSNIWNKADKSANSFDLAVWFALVLNVESTCRDEAMILASFPDPMKNVVWLKDEATYHPLLYTMIHVITCWLY